MGHTGLVARKTKDVVDRESGSAHTRVGPSRFWHTLIRQNLRPFALVF